MFRVDKYIYISICGPPRLWCWPIPNSHPVFHVRSYTHETHSMMAVLTAKDHVIFNPSYYAFGHFSRLGDSYRSVCTLLYNMFHVYNNTTYCNNIYIYLFVYLFINLIQNYIKQTLCIFHIIWKCSYVHYQ